MTPLEILFTAVSVIIASTVHEFAHGYVAMKLGDLTAKVNGRLTLNPLSHIDPIGAISFLLFRFGWSKPVPINPMNFPNPLRGMALSSIAGPASNILLGFIASLLVRLSVTLNMPIIGGGGSWYVIFISVNCAFAAFNLIPIPPLDGSRILLWLLPNNLKSSFAEIEKYGFIIILLLISPYSPLSTIFYSIFSGIADILYRIILLPLSI